MAYATADDFLEHLRLTPNSAIGNTQAADRMAYVGELLEVAKERIDTQCGRTFDDLGSITRTYRLAAWQRRSRLLLRADFHTLTTVTVDGTVLDADDWEGVSYGYVNRPFRAIDRVDGGCWGAKNDVAGEGGWASAPATVKEASLIHVGRYWLRRSAPGGIISGDGDMVMAMPNLDRDLLDMLDTFCVAAVT